MVGITTSLFESLQANYKLIIIILFTFRFKLSEGSLPFYRQFETSTSRQFYTYSARPIPTIQTRTQTKLGSCFACNKPGHWRAQCPLDSSKFQPAQGLAAHQEVQGQVEGVVNSIFASHDLSDNCHDEISHSNDLDAVVELKLLLNYEFTSGQPNTRSVRGRLALCYDEWVKLGASGFILSVVRDG